VRCNPSPGNSARNKADNPTVAIEDRCPTGTKRGPSGVQTPHEFSTGAPPKFVARVAGMMEMLDVRLKPTI
jgi:hypothetical protein